MGKNPFHKAKPVLVFNGDYTLIAIFRSIRAASDYSGMNPQAISFACTGRAISSGCFYFRHLSNELPISINDIGKLKLQDYDEMYSRLLTSQENSADTSNNAPLPKQHKYIIGSSGRRYFSVREMARRRRIQEIQKQEKKSSDKE